MTHGAQERALCLVGGFNFSGAFLYQLVQAPLFAAPPQEQGCQQDENAHKQSYYDGIPRLPRIHMRVTAARNSNKQHWRHNEDIN
jgi:hypothetical protein